MKFGDLIRFILLPCSDSVTVNGILCQCGERTGCRQAKKSGKECDCGIKILEIVLWVGIEPRGMSAQSISTI